MSSLNSDDTTTRPGRRLLSWFILAALIVAGVLLWNNRLVVADEFRLIGYTPSSDVATLSNRISFTGTGQRYFYASHPAIEDKTTFNKDCGNTEIHATILGCYTRDTIYIYDVTDSRLDGVQEVTSAHETLHAAYARLSSSQRSTVDDMLTRQFNSMSGNAAFAERISVYNSLSQADKLNELHSIFGTEVADLSSELETYYKQYFNDRSVVTGYYKAYESQFDNLKAQQDSLKTQIETLKNDIDSSEAQYKSDRSALDSDIQSFNNRANGGYYSSQEQFSSDRSQLVARSNELNQTAQKINDDIEQYNDLIKQYNEVSIQTQDLQNSLDSNSVQSAPSV